MVGVVSRFRVANGMEADVARAFQERPRAVEGAPGFLWLEVFVDRSDPALFYLVTRWTDIESYEQWHGSPAHRESHALIPKGLKLDPAWTQVVEMARIPGTLGPPLAEVVADSALLFASHASASTELHLFVLGLDGTIRHANAAASRHLAPAGTLEGALLTEYMPVPDAARLTQMLAQPARRDSSIRLHFAAANCAPFSLECWLHVYPDGATLLGEPTYRRDQQLQDELMAINQELAVLSRERSREVRSERDLREAAETLNRERNAFLKILAHELRQPIGSALAAVGVLRKLNPDPALERPRALLERQLKQITRLVEDLADTARIASGEVELHRRPFDVAAQLRELATGWEAIAHEQHKRFTFRSDGSPLPVDGDPERLQQVFSNLAGNAFKYTPPGGAIDITVTADNGLGVVTITDEGEGIAPERLPQIFELFQRATTTGSGLGVGLAVVHALIAAHGGSVHASSAGIGHGSTFIVRIPLFQSKPEI